MPEGITTNVLLENMQDLGKILMLIGTVLFVAGAALYFLKGIPFLGKLPGDILIRKENFTFYFPLATSLLLSLLLTLLLYFFKKPS
jgi:Protein of unknown function (DUF2905)